MRSFQDLKRESRYKLRGLWGKAILLHLLLWVPGLLAGLTEQGLRMAGKFPAFGEGAFAPASPSPPAMLAALGCGILCFSLWAPFAQGQARWYWLAHSGLPGGAKEAFYYFKSWRSCGKSIWLSFQIAFRTGLWFLLFSVPPFFAAGSWVWFRRQMASALDFGAMEPIFRILLALWPLLAFGLTGIQAQRYFLAPRILAQKPEEPVKRILRRSSRLSRGYRGRIWMLYLSFWPWMLPKAGILLFLMASLFMPVLFWGAPASLLLSVILGFYWRPFQQEALACCAAGFLYGTIQQEETLAENMTREYFAKTGEAILPENFQSTPMPWGQLE